MKDITVSDLLLEAARAEYLEWNHQRACRARAEGRDCASCLGYEADWLAADLALEAFQQRISQEVQAS